jgi:copper chaperone CopZ
MSGGDKRAVFHAPDISCDGCTNSIRVELEDMDGVTSVVGDPAAKSVAVAFDDPATVDGIQAAMDDIGFPVASVEMAG